MLLPKKTCPKAVRSQNAFTKRASRAFAFCTTNVNNGQLIYIGHLHEQHLQKIIHVRVLFKSINRKI